MGSSNIPSVLVTGASGHIGQEVCRQLEASGHQVLPVDIAAEPHTIACDLTRQDQLSEVFRERPISCVIHLAATLPTAFAANPLAGADLNLTGSFQLLREAVAAGVKRFIFASSISVYGLGRAGRVTEEDPAIPDEPYGGSKRCVELVAESLANTGAIEFVSLRVSRVIGAGIKKTSSSPWRSQIFDSSTQVKTITLPFGPEASISLLHVEDAAQMFLKLMEAPSTEHRIYNTPAEICQIAGLKKLIEEARGIPVELGPTGAHGGPVCEGRRFAQEFHFRLIGVRERISKLQRRASADQ
ncbi:MAG TPA: NAD(P)-dependent oxidoreductase [Terriglobales bacterium]|nr:NAD(P)-dependent oxidoreductase [Terriglobales bacterium]